VLAAPPSVFSDCASGTDAVRRRRAIAAAHRAAVPDTGLTRAALSAEGLTVASGSYSPFPGTDDLARICAQTFVELGPAPCWYLLPSEPSTVCRRSRPGPAT